MGLFDKFGKKLSENPGGVVSASRPIGFTSAPPEWAEEREDFYDHFFGGNAVVSRETPPRSPAIHVYLYPPHGARTYSTVITSGMSDLPMPVEPGENLAIEKRRVELFMRVPTLAIEQSATDMPWQVDMLRFVARLPFERCHPLVAFKTFTLGGIPDSKVLKHGVLMPPYYESPEFAYGMTHLDGTRVSFLWLDFLTDSELEAKLSGGSDALMQIFKRNKHSPILNTARPSYV